MRYRKFGRTGLFVSELCFGSMTFGGKTGIWEKIGNTEQQEADRLVGVALDAGINFFDTADSYADGDSERILGRALGRPAAGRRAREQGAQPRGARPQRGGTVPRAHRRVGRRRRCAAWAPTGSTSTRSTATTRLTPLDETMRALDDLVRAGKLRYVGCSNVAAWQIAKANGLAAAHDWSRFVSLQAYYTISARDIEREIVPLLADEAMALMVWSPLAGGLLSGKYGREQDGPPGSRRVVFDFPLGNRERAYDCIDAMRPIAAAHGVSVARVALAWLLAQPQVTTIIIGAKNEAQLADNLAATTLTLAADELAALDRVSALPSEYPGWMIARQAQGREPPATPG